MGFVDIHQHVVYGVDDGPRSAEESLEMLRLAQRDGVTHIIATSHAYPAMEPFPAERYLRRLGVLRQACRDEGIAVSISAGCEIFYSDVAIRQLQERRIPTLADTSCVLVEFDPLTPWEGILDAVRKLSNRGYRTVVAHCERYQALYGRLEEIRRLRSEFPVAFQINANTIIGRLPRKVRKFRDGMLDGGLTDFIASDAHNCTSRPIRLAQAFAEIEKRFGASLARALFVDNPRELINAGRTPADAAGPT